MSLDEHYLFSEPFPQRIGNVDQTVAAEEVASGVLVVIHLLAGGNCPANQELLKVARGLPPASVRYLREIGDHKGTPFVVTEPLPENLPVRKWLEQVTGIPMVLPEPGPRPMTASEPDANKFKKQVWKVPAIPPTLDQAKPGEFTQMFRASGAPLPAPQPAPAAPVPPASSTPPGPGEFTQLMQAQGYQSPKPAAPPAAPTGSFATPPSRQAGEFTQLMQAASMGSGIRPAAPPPVPPAPPSQATEVHPTPEVDEFARMMQDSAPSPVAPPSPSVPSDYEATRLFSAPPPPEVLRAPAPLDFGSAPPAATPASREHSPLTSAQPGEFTRMLQSPMAPPPREPMFSGSPDPVVERTPGGFTQLFESPFSSAEPAARTYAPTPAPSFPSPGARPPSAPPPIFPTKSPAPDQNEFDRLFNEPKAPPIQGTQAFPAPAGGAPSTPAQQGPSEYTLMFKSPAKPPAAPAPPAPAPQAARPAVPATSAKPPANYMILIYVLGGLLVVAIAVVAYLLMKK